jgi:hypothetical protein
MDITIMILVVSLGFYAMIGFLVVNATRARQRKAELQAETQAKLIDKFGSSPELASFLGTEEGRRFLTGVEAAPVIMAQEKVLAGIRKAVVLSFIGGAFLALCIPYSTRNEGFLIAGGLLFALGAGYFVAAMISMRLSRAWSSAAESDSTSPRP